MTEQLVRLDLIKDNPYQGRTTYTAIEELGRSIAADDIQEKPKARVSTGSKKNTEYELKFGHRRLRAFQWLKDNFKALGLADRYDGYTVMPLDVESLTDEEMNRGVIVENAQREDLNVIEEAQMMRDYGQRWNKTSEQIGEVFGKNGATVRGIIRLLDLPEPVQAKVAAGEITQSAARSLLTIARIDPEQIDLAVVQLQGGSTVDDVLGIAMTESEMAVKMWSGWQDGKPRGGEGLWTLDTKPDKFPMKHLPELRAADVAKSLGLEFTAELRIKIEDYIGTVTRAPAFAAEFAETNKNPGDAVLMERIDHLLTPPACASCPLHASSDRSHYCGAKICHQRKTTAWVADEMARASKRTGFAVYDAAVDGKAILPISDRSYDDDYKKHIRLVENKDTAIRIAPHKQEYSKHKWTDSNFCRLVLVGEKAIALKKARAESTANKNADSSISQEERNKKWKQEAERRDACDSFLEQYVSKLFSSLFDGITNCKVLSEMTSEPLKKNEKSSDAAQRLRVELARMVLRDLGGYNWNLQQKGPVEAAKFFQGVATEWGVKLPGDFLDVAKGYAPVAVETDPIEKKKVKK